MTTRTFPLSVALSAVHNRLVCPFPDYRDFLSYVVGWKVALWDVERARLVAARMVNSKYPQLQHFPPPDKTDSGNANKYVKSVVKQVGHDVVVIPPSRGKATKKRTASAAIKALR